MVVPEAKQKIRVPEHSKLLRDFFGNLNPNEIILIKHFTFSLPSVLNF